MRHCLMKSDAEGIDRAIASESKYMLYADK